VALRCGHPHDDPCAKAAWFRDLRSKVSPTHGSEEMEEGARSFQLIPTIYKLRSILEAARLDQSLHPYFLTSPPCAAIYVKGDELQSLGDRIGEALREQGGQVDEPIAQPKVTPYGGDWHVLYWPDVRWI